MQALSTTPGNYDSAMRVKGLVERMTARLQTIDNQGQDSERLPHVVQTDMWQRTSLPDDQNPYVMRGSVHTAEDKATSASVEVLFGMDTTHFTQGPKSVLDSVGNVIDQVQEYKIDSPAGTQTATYNPKNGTVTFLDEPVPDAAW